MFLSLNFIRLLITELTHERAIWSWDTGQWLSCFDSCQLTILWMSYIKDVDLPRHAWDTSPFLLIASPTPPVQSVDAYVRTLGQSRDNQTKRGWPYSMSMGLCPTPRFARAGAPLSITVIIFMSIIVPILRRIWRYVSVRVNFKIYLKLVLQKWRV